MTFLLEDRELLARFREGDVHAMEQVYRHYAPGIARFLRRGFQYNIDGQPAMFNGYGSTFELEGATQEVFTRAFDERARLAYDGMRPYQGFLVGIARNVVLDALRRRARRREVLSPFEHEIGGQWMEHEQTAYDPAESMQERHARALVQRFIEEECDDEERRIYLLRFEHDRSQQAAAEELGLTRIQMRRRESKLKKRLLSYLQRMDYTR